MSRESTEQEIAKLLFRANLPNFTGGEIYTMLEEAVRTMNKYELGCLLAAVDKSFDDLE